MDEDVYFKKEITFKHAGETLRFRVSQDLFSSFQVDIGTRFLLRTLTRDTHSFNKILDLGCGYGPIGLTLKKLNPGSEVHLVDRDALAVEYSRQNAVLNALDGVSVYGSLGYDDVPDADFDLVAANIPGKAGEAVISHLLRDAAYFLKPGGTAAVVVVAPLEKTVAGILKVTPDININLHQNRSGHAVFHYSFSGGGGGAYVKAYDRGIYDRGEAEFQYKEIHYFMQTARGVPEFDSLDYRTELMLEGIEKIDGTVPKRAVVFNPGQGHVPVVLWQLLEPDELVLVDRDLLALRYSRRNLVLNGCPGNNIIVRHQVGIESDDNEPADLIAGVLREEEGAAAMASFLSAAAGRLALGGTLILSGGSTAVTRLVEKATLIENLKTMERVKRWGYSRLVLQRK